MKLALAILGVAACLSTSSTADDSHEIESGEITMVGIGIPQASLTALPIGHPLVHQTPVQVVGYPVVQQFPGGQAIAYTSPVGGQRTSGLPQRIVTSTFYRQPGQFVNSFSNVRGTFQRPVGVGYPAGSASFASTFNQRPVSPTGVVNNAIGSYASSNQQPQVPYGGIKYQPQVTSYRPQQQGFSVQQPQQQSQQFVSGVNQFPSQGTYQNQFQGSNYRGVHQYVSEQQNLVPRVPQPFIPQQPYNPNNPVQSFPTGQFGSSSAQYQPVLSTNTQTEQIVGQTGQIPSQYTPYNLQAGQVSQPTAFSSNPQRFNQGQQLGPNPSFSSNYLSGQSGVSGFQSSSNLGASEGFTTNSGAINQPSSNFGVPSNQRFDSSNNFGSNPNIGGQSPSFGSPSTPVLAGNQAAFGANVAGGFGGPEQSFGSGNLGFSYQARHSQNADSVYSTNIETVSSDGVAETLDSDGSIDYNRSAADGRACHNICKDRWGNLTCCD